MSRYDTIADFYASDSVDRYDDVVSVTLLEMIGSVRGKRVLDLACGQGRFTRELARRGGSVVGIDLSEAMLAKALEVEGRDPLGVDYVQANVSDPEVLLGEVFDVVVSSFGLSDIDDLAGSLATVRRVLTVRGAFTFSILHPCFSGGGGVAGAWPPDGSYHDEGWWLPNAPLSKLRNQVGANHRTLSTYVNSLAAHGLLLREMAEPVPDAEWAARAPGAARQPVYLVARCEAVGKDIVR